MVRPVSSDPFDGAWARLAASAMLANALGIGCAPGLASHAQSLVKAGQYLQDEPLELDHGDHHRREDADDEHDLHGDPETWHDAIVTIGAAIFVAALGAILRYAVSDSVDFIDIPTVGLILMLAGIVGLIAAVGLELGRAGGGDRGRF